MTGETHTVGGTLFVLAGAPLIASIVGIEISPLELMIAALVVGPMAGLLPDADTPNSLISRGWTPMRKLLGPFSRPLAKLLGLLLSVPARIFGATARAGGVEHRGATHTPQFMMLWTIGALPFYMLFFALVAYAVSLVTAVIGIPFDPSSVWQWQKDNFLALLPAAMLYVFLGYLSHLVLDSITPSGIPWTGRKTRHRTNKGTWKTGYKSYNITKLKLPEWMLIVTDSPAERPFRWGCQLLVLIFILLVIALPVASRLDEGYGLKDALVYSTSELAAGEGHRSPESS